jgi:hypothetical protein
MAIELSYEWFNNGDDIVPRYSGEEVILNTGVTYTRAGNDSITGIGPGRRPSIYDFGIYNSGRLYTEDDDDIITGTYDATEYSLHNANYVSPPNNGRSPYRDDRGNFYYYAPDPNGPIPLPLYNYGIKNSGTIDTGMGDDTITGSNLTESGYLILDSLYSVAIVRDSVGIDNGGTINTGEGADSLISNGKLINYGQVLLEGGDDTITTYGVIYNDGEINTGSGNDSIIAYGGFESGLNNSGRVLLGPGEDTLYGFGSGDFYGGDDEDTLELTPGSYIVGISGAGVTFTKGSSVMITSDFEKLRVNSIFMGSTTRDFSSFVTNGEIISV